MWPWDWWLPRIDPLAQTFCSLSNRIVSAVGVRFSKKDTTLPVTVQIRGVTTGLPNNQVFVEKVIAPSEITLTGETKITFANPFYAEAGTKVTLWSFSRTATTTRCA